jgi:hypothetical protein
MHSPLCIPCFVVKQPNTTWQTLVTKEGTYWKGKKDQAQILMLSCSVLQPVWILILFPGFTIYLYLFNHPQPH